MVSQCCHNMFNFYLLGPYYVCKDNITSYKNKNLVLSQHEGEVAVITGGHRGIGAEVTKDLLRCGMHVIMGCRRVEDGNRFINTLREGGLGTGETTILPLDLTSLQSVKDFAAAVLNTTSKINFLINNAGIIISEYVETEDKMDSVWQVNYLSHFLLCHILLPTLQSTPGQTKVVNVSSLTHHSLLDIDFDSLNNKDKFNRMTNYSTSKLAQIMFTLYLNAKLSAINSNIVVVAAHPGIVNTEAFDGTFLKKYFPWIPALFFKTPEQGAKPIVYAALYGKGGEYIGNCVPESVSSLAQDIAKQQRLFEESKKSLEITEFGNLF